MKTQTIVIGFIGVAVLGLMALVSCAGLLFFAFRGLDSSISPAVDKLFAAIDQDRIDQYYDSNTSSDFQQATTREQLADLAKLIKTRLGPLKSKSMRQFNVRQVNANQFAEINYNATFEHGSGTIAIRMKRDAGDWQLVSFTVNSPEFDKDRASGKCPLCGEPHTATAQFCPKCGKPLREKPKAEESAKPPEAPEGDAKPAEGGTDEDQAAESEQQPDCSAGRFACAKRGGCL